MHTRAKYNDLYIDGNVSFVIFVFRRVFIVNESASRIVNPVLRRLVIRCGNF
jgi:hypothetical protein